MDPVEMLGSADLRAKEKTDIIQTEKRLRAALGNLHEVLGGMIEDK